MLKRVFCFSILLLALVAQAQETGVTEVPEIEVPEPIVIDDQEVAGQETVLEKRNRVMEVAGQLPFVLQLYKPTYLLPYYYTASPYTSIYEGNTPDDQPVHKGEVKFQLSLLLPLWEDMFGQPMDLSFAYSQLSYWQLYASSPWFRETDYEPEAILTYRYSPDLHFRGHINHQSNGRGGGLERSWNRAIFGVDYGGNNWLLSGNVWALIFKDSSSDLHNPNITDYLGNAQIRGSYKLHKLVFTLQIQNFTHGGDRMQFTGTVSRQLGDSPLRLYLQGFSGYGQSLIEYDHFTNAVGIGFSVNDWII